MNSSLRERHDRFLALLAPVRFGLARFCRALERDPESARDLAAEAIVIAYEHLDDIRDSEKFRSYLFTTASRLAKRSRWRSRNRVSYDPAFAESLVDTGTSPEMAVEVEELYAALRKLPDAMREAVILFEITGFSLEEIRQIQSGSLSGVKSRVARGREKLAKILRVSEAPRNVISASPSLPRLERNGYAFTMEKAKHL